MCLFVWQQSFLQLSEEQLESVSEPCLRLFSKFVAVVLSLVKEGFFLSPDGPRASSGG